MTDAPAPEEIPKPDPHGEDRMGAPSVAAGRLVMWAAIVFAFASSSAAILWGAYKWRVAVTPVAIAHAFPAPQLEANQTPRATASTSHGPGPYRPVPEDDRSGVPGPISDPLMAAMQAEAARRAAAYDPVQTGARR